MKELFCFTWTSEHYRVILGTHLSLPQEKRQKLKNAYEKCGETNMFHKDTKYCNLIKIKVSSCMLSKYRVIH